MSSFILKFADVAIQPSSGDGAHIRRAIGFVEVEQLFPLLDIKSLAPNPRSAKRNPIIEGILGTLQDTPELFRYKSKGLLISSHNVEELERRRFRVEFSKDFVDGVLDGGHNLFAIGLHLLSTVVDEGALKRIRTWDHLDAAWDEHGDAVRALPSKFDIQVGIELLYPSQGGQNAQDAFDEAAFQISQARNANTQVKTEAFQNKLGFYDVLKEALPKELSRRVEWKPGEVEDDSGAKPINVRDVVALAWIPLNLANENNLLPMNVSVIPQNIYRNKGECSDKFNTLMSHDEVTEPVGGKAGQTRQLVHKTVESCLNIAGDLPRLLDLIYEKFPTAYNQGGNYRFGRRSVVKVYNPERVAQLKKEGKDVSGYTMTRPVTPFFRRSSPEMTKKYPEAFIIPFVTALSELMEIKNGLVAWKVKSIDELVLKKLEKAAPLFDGQLDAYEWDPQKLAKSASSHKQVASYYRVL